MKVGPEGDTCFHWESRPEAQKEQEEEELIKASTGQERD